MTVPDAVIALVVAALPGATLWDSASADNPPADDLVVFDGLVTPLPPRRYVVVYADPGTVEALSLCTTADFATFRWQVTSVAPDAAQARWLAARVRDGIASVRPVATGWECALIHHRGAQSPRRDESVQERPAVYGTDQFSVVATRA